MKRAKLVKVFAVEIECPNCGESFEGPSGAFLIYEHEYEQVPAQQKCLHCGQVSATPPNPWQRKVRNAA